MSSPETDQGVRRNVQIFISWSGDASKQCAEALRDWLPYMNQAIVPFVSSQDISKGERGLNKIASQLQECSFGIVCVTRDNQSAPWINFESGALSRELGESSLVPFLLDMPIKDLSGPLTQFQATDSSSEADVWAMVKSINDKCAVTVDQERSRTTFDRFWGDLTSKLATVREQLPQSDVPERETPEILNELVGLVREQSARIGALENTISSSGNISSHYTINEPREVNIEFDAAKEQRALRIAGMARDIIGRENVKRVGKNAYGVVLHCSQKGMSKARMVYSELAILASDNHLSIDIACESEILSFPPF